MGKKNTSGGPKVEAAAVYTSNAVNLRTRHEADVSAGVAGGMMAGL